MSNVWLLGMRRGSTVHSVYHRGNYDSTMIVPLPFHILILKKATSRQFVVSQTM